MIFMTRSTTKLMQLEMKRPWLLLRKCNGAKEESRRITKIISTEENQVSIATRENLNSEYSLLGDKIKDFYYSELIICREY